MKENHKDTDVVSRRDAMLIIRRFRIAATGVVNIFVLKMNIKELTTSLDRGSNVLLSFDFHPSQATQSNNNPKIKTATLPVQVDFLFMFYLDTYLLTYSPF